MTNIQLAVAPADYESGKQLFQEYAASLEVDLCFQSFEQELLEVPQMYGPPEGGLLLVGEPGAWVGCVAIRRLDAQTAELKRMYLRANLRGQGLGRRLLTRALELARTLGYTSIRLDTLPSMESAIALYRTMGFDEISSYRQNPVAGALYFEKQFEFNE